MSDVPSYILTAWNCLVTENLGLGGSDYFRHELFPVGCWKEAENLPVPKPKATEKAACE